MPASAAIYLIADIAYHNATVGPCFLVVATVNQRMI
jgi:hypothetical protein